MIRRFKRHDIREVNDLTGVWDFTLLGDVDPDAIDAGAIEFDDLMAVPCCFDATPRYAGQRGLAAYRTHLALTDECPYRLILDGVHHWCRVLLDGEPLCDHIGGFTQFHVDIPAGLPRRAELVILVDNRFDAERCPTHLDYFDWYHFGGLARGAELHRLGATWIDAVRLVTEDADARKVRMTIDYAGVDAPGAVDLSIDCGGEMVVDETIELTEPIGRIERTVTLDGAALWSPAAPNLHDVHIRLGDDDIRERLGIREVTVADREIRINGQALRLLGFCRHEAHPQFGHTQPTGLLIADIQQLKDLGCNFVRGSHYPQDTAFLDLCDEMGLCVWCESIGWGHTAEHLTNERFIAAQRINGAEMVAAAVNRPSVIMWGILNEATSDDPACRPTYEDLLGRLRSLDPTRPVTYACNRWRDDVCLDLVDIVSVNVYPGWYGESIEEIPDTLDKIVARMDEAGYGDKPIIISEIGAGAIRGWDDWNAARWSETYQTKLLTKVIEHMFGSSKHFAGLSIWQFCDIRTAEGVSRVLGRPRSFNNKGIVDEYRRGKRAYQTVKDLFGRYADR